MGRNLGNYEIDNYHLKTKVKGACGTKFYRSSLLRERQRQISRRLIIIIENYEEKTKRRYDEAEYVSISRDGDDSKQDMSMKYC